MFYSSIQQWVQGSSPGRGPVPQKLEHFLKYTTWNLRPGENERHNLMPLMAFFIGVHSSIVLFQCHVWHPGAWPPCPLPKSALAIGAKVVSKGLPKKNLQGLLVQEVQQAGCPSCHPVTERYTDCHGKSTISTTTWLRLWGLVYWLIGVKRHFQYKQVISCHRSMKCIM